MMATKAQTASSFSSKVRKRDTGEQGNRGEFAAVSRGEADISIPAPHGEARPIIGEMPKSRPVPSSERACASARVPVSGKTSRSVPA